jgi:hypothetical protein
MSMCPIQKPYVIYFCRVLWLRNLLHCIHTWDLLPFPFGKRAIGSRWFYNIKIKSDGSIERYKALLVAKGYSQEYGIDYEETFVTVAEMKTARSLIAVAASFQWKISQNGCQECFLER